MKRRDFIIGSAGLGGFILPLPGLGEVRPCPPPTLTSSGEQTSSTACGTSAPLDAVPGWYEKIVRSGGTLEWHPVPTSNGPYRGANFVDVWQDVPGSFNFAPTYGNVYATTAENFFNSWVGASVDNDRGDLLLVANGGHSSDGWANHAFGLRLRSETPGWYRINEPTPFEVASQNILTPSNPFSWPDTEYHRWPDGRSRAMHCGAGVLYRAGKVWFPFQAATNFLGDNGMRVVSWNRDHVNMDGTRMPSGPGSAPQPYEQNAGPWRNVTATQIPKLNSGYEQWDVDPVTGMIVGFNGSRERGGFTSMIVTINPSAGNVTTTAFATFPVSAGIGRCVASDYAATGQDRWRYLVSYNPGSGKLVVIDLKTKLTFLEVAVSDSSWMSYYSYVALYHPASRSIIFGDTYAQQNSKSFSYAGSVHPNWVGKLVRVQVPTRADGSYAGGIWQVSAITPSANPGAGTTPNMDSRRSFTKLNIINMGSGQSPAWALVSALAHDLPAYVLPLPAGDF